MMKVIDDYSKQNEAKIKEIEMLSAKLDHKNTKIDWLKKHKVEQDTRVTKLKSTLDHVKAFLKLLNSNYVKAMK